jgi:E3 ubiquitin-protein ligase RFWD3
VFMTCCPWLLGYSLFLLQVSLLCPGETEKIRLPNNTKTVKDLCILPNGLVALASLGRKLAVFRLLLLFFVCK